MRVISGSAKGIKLVSVPGKTTRPITDQVKEALFNIIGFEIEGKTILDLFGGTGAVGIEALSRGAEKAVFIDNNYQAYQVIQKNLNNTKLTPYADTLKMDAFSYLSEKPPIPFDIIYIAPPQYREMWQKAMQILNMAPGWMHPESVVIVQIDPKEFSEEITYANFCEFDRRFYGDTMLIFYEPLLAE